MKVLGRDKLLNFSAKHSDAKGALEAWFQEVNSDECNWTKSQDIKDRFSSASLLPEKRVIFNIKGNNYRLVTNIRYESSIVVVEWVGTHGDYDKIVF